MLKRSFVFICLCLMSLPGFAQEEVKKDPLSEEGGQVIIRNNPEAIAPEENTQNTPPSEEDPEIRELELARQKQLEKMQKIQKATAPLVSPTGGALDEIQKLGHQQLDAVAMFDVKVLAILQRTLKEGLLSNTPATEVRAMIFAKTKGSLMEGFLRRFPKIVDVLVDILRDKDAFSSLLGILVRREDLKTYGYVWLAIFIFGLLVKRRLVKPKWNFTRRLRWNMSINLVLMCFSFFVFYNFFADELAPTIAIFQKHF